jgi:preprotein translocase subunit SecE
MADEDEPNLSRREKAEQRRQERAQQRAQRARPAKSQSGRPAERQGMTGFVRESWGELNRVQWPDRPALIQGTIVVLLTCIVVGLYLYGLDAAFSRVAGWLITQQAG